MSNCRQYIDSKTIILSILSVSNTKSITYSKLQCYLSELENLNIENYEIAYRISTDTFKRIGLYNEDIFELVGDTLILKDKINPIQLDDKLKQYLIKVTEA